MKRKLGFLSKTITAIIIICMVLLNISPVHAEKENRSDLCSNSSSYYLSGVSVYKEPAKASELFEIKEIIAYRLSNESAGLLNANAVSNGATIIDIDTTERLADALFAHPFAIVMIDAELIHTLDLAELVKVAKTQHIMLVSCEHDPNNLCWHFDQYCVVEKAAALDYVDTRTLADADSLKLLEKLNLMKEDIMYRYDALVCAEFDELDTIPEENIVDLDLLSSDMQIYQDLTGTKSSWNTLYNNEIRFFVQPTAYIFELPVYSSYSNGTRIMTAYLYEAILHTGNEVSINDHRWYQVRGWKYSSTGVTLIQGWVRSWYSESNSAFNGDSCIRPYMYGRYFTSNWSYVAGRGVGCTIQLSTNLYNSSGTLITSLPIGSVVWFKDDSEYGYAGYSNPHYCAISGYTKNGTYHSCSATTFVNAGFNTGNPSSYRLDIN